jgi:O-antigen/teichoic acid export membrane protein
VEVPRTLKQAGFYTAARLFSKFLSFAALLVFARAIGPSHFGVYTYLISISLIFAPFADLGMLPEVIRRSKSRVIKHFQKFFGTFMTLNVLTSLIIPVAVTLLGYSPLLGALTALVFLSKNVLDYTYKTHMAWGRVRFVSQWSIIEKVLFSISVLVLPKKTSFLLASLILSQIVPIIFLSRKVNLSVILPRKLGYFSLPFFFSTLFSAISARLPLLVYDWRFGVTTLGNFGAASTIYQALAVMLSEVQSFLTMRAGKFNESQWLSLKKVVVAFSFVSVGVIILLKSPIIQLVNLLYGGSYDNPGILFFYNLFALPAVTLLYYPTSKMLYHAPRSYASFWFVSMISFVLSALVAPGMEAAVILRVAADYVRVAAGYILVRKLQS